MLTNKDFAIKVGHFEKELAPLEKHLTLRNFLVGYNLTLADVILVFALSQALQFFIDHATRHKTFPNLTRYCNLILQMPAFIKIFGRVTFC